MKNWLFRNLFGAEFAELQNHRAERIKLREEIARLEDNRQRIRDRRVARIKLDGGLPEDEIARRLAGTHNTPVLLAIVALLDSKIVQMSDRATNPPSEVNTVDLRTYEAGGANAVTEFKSQLQGLTEAATAAEATPAA